MKTDKQPGRKSNSIHEPVLSHQAVLDYFNRGLSVTSMTSSIRRQSAQSRSGTHTSFFRGSGLDYDDSRAYQPGDEIRNINWRLMARTSHLYTKVFQEERESSVMILIDRRARMRFGTRERLKVTRALEIASYLAGMSLMQGYSVGFSVLQSPVLQMSSQRSHARVQEYLFAAATACPPLNENLHEVKLSRLLSQLQYASMPGDQLVLISDFHDLEDDDSVILSQMAAQHQIQAIQILDPAEELLPEGVWLIDSYTDATPLKVNASEESFKQSYQTLIANKQAQIESVFLKNKIPFGKLYTNDHFDEVIKVINDV